MKLLVECLLLNMPKLVDTNLIVRFLLNDNPQQALASEKVFKQSSDLVITDIAVAETVWTLQSFYGFSRQEIVEKIFKFLQSKNFICNQELLFNSLFLYLNHNISFVDAYFAAYAEIEKLEGIYSFDEGLDKIKTIKRFKP